MSWPSILPASVAVVEAWLVRLFVRPRSSARLALTRQLLLGILVIAPAALVLAYDVVLFACRVVGHALPARPRPLDPARADVRGTAGRPWGRGRGH
jgi:hypothetical protein